MTTDNKRTEVKDTQIITAIRSKKLNKEFIALEEQIRKANKAFLVIGESLTKINEGRMYKSRGFGTFEAYVSCMFDFTRDYAYKIMNATRIYNLLKKKYKPSELPKTETHCRPLTKIEKDSDILLIWARVLNSGKIIGKTVQEQVDLHLGKGEKIKTQPEPETGTPDTVTSVQDTEEVDDVDYAQKCRVLQAEVTRLQNELEKARSISGGIAKTKMARKMIQAGFSQLVNSATDDQKEELIATKKALLG